MERKISPGIFCLKITFWSQESPDFNFVGCFSSSDVGVGVGVGDVIVKAKKANFVEEKNFKGQQLDA